VFVVRCEGRIMSKLVGTPVVPFARLDIVVAHPEFVAVLGRTRAGQVMCVLSKISTGRTYQHITRGCGYYKAGHAMADVLSRAFPEHAQRLPLGGTVHSMAKCIPGYTEARPLQLVEF
jgi:hypothetical protein